jgi:hypothetical protein
VLCSASFEALASTGEVRESALSHVERLNGAMAVYNYPIQFAGVAQITQDGQVHRTLFAEACLRGRGKARAVGVALGRDGQPGGVAVKVKLRRPIYDHALTLHRRNRPAILGDDGDVERQPVNLQGPSEAMSGWIPESTAV